jgi:hypothetical protein
MHCGMNEMRGWRWTGAMGRSAGWGKGRDGRGEGEQGVTSYPVYENGSLVTDENER